MDSWSESRRQAYERFSEHSVSAPVGFLTLGEDPQQIPVFSGTEEMSLTLGAGHLRETAALNGSGNTAIAGHRDGFFRALRNLERGDTLEVGTAEGTRRYRVSKLWIVDPEDVWVLEDTSRSSLTLITCHPFFFVGDAPNRYVVRAVLAEQARGAAADLASTGSPKTIRR